MFVTGRKLLQKYFWLGENVFDEKFVITDEDS